MVERWILNARVKFTKIALDFDADKQAGLMYTRSTVTGETKLLLRVVNDYNKGLTYVMKSSGDCTRYQLTESLVKEIPSGATGTSTEQDYMGTDLFFDLRRYDIPDVNNATTTTFAFTPVGDGECVPLFMGAVNAAIGMDSLFVYTQFKNGTTHPEWRRDSSSGRGGQK
nr:hypothetical protein BaRGS_020768 [Batillaria attramentaria]